MNVNKQAKHLGELFPDVSVERWEKLSEIADARTAAILGTEEYNIANLVDEASEQLEGPEEHVAFGIVLANFIQYLETASVPTS